MDDRRPCRCLLEDAAPDIAALVQEVVASMDEEDRASKTLYAQRLQICLACPALHDGTCALCGCYVEVRAATRGNRCPDVPPQWAAVP